MTTIGYYPGCSLHGTAKDYGHSVETLAKLLDVTLHEIDDWNCCGASSAHSLNHQLSISLPARTMSQAQRGGFKDVLAPCAMFFSNLKIVNHAFESESVKAETNQTLEHSYTEHVHPLNLIQFIQKYGTEKLAGAGQILKGMKVACYYGCLLVRPLDVMKHERPEDPQDMEALVTLTGATPVDWNFKTECCGGGLVMSRAEAVVELVARIMENAKNHGADVILAACPMCHANLDMMQADAGKLRKTSLNIPILYLSELMALALGAQLKELLVNTHITDATGYLKKFLAGQKPAASQGGSV